MPHFAPVHPLLFFIQIFSIGNLASPSSLRSVRLSNIYSPHGDELIMLY